MPFLTSLALAGALAASGAQEVTEPPSASLPGAVASQRSRLALGAEADIDLALGKEVPRGEGDVRVSETTPGMFLMEPAEGVRVVDVRALARMVGKESLGRWVAPPPSHKGFRSGKGILLSVDPELGSRGFVAVPGGSVFVVHLWLGDGPRPTLVIEHAAGEQRLLLPRPEAAPVAEEGASGAWRLLLPAPADRPQALDALVGVRFEVEAPYGSDSWVPVAEAPAGRAAIDDARPFDGLGSRALARMRARFTDASGRASEPGPARDYVRGALDAEGRALRVEEALGALAGPDYQSRIEARAVLVALAEEALPRLEILEEEGADGAFGLAVTEVLSALDAAGGGGLSARRLLRSARGRAVRELDLTFLGSSLAGDVELDASSAGGASRETARQPSVGAQAALEAWLGPVPEALLDGDPLGRAHAALGALDRAQRGAAVRDADGAVERGDLSLARARTWAGALAEIDPDPRIRSLIDFSLEVTLQPSRGAFDAPAAAWFVPEDTRAPDEPLAPRTLDGLPTHADILRFRLESRPELADFELGPPLARVLSQLARSGGAGVWQDAVYDYDVRSVDLALRLIDRARKAEGDARQRYVDAAAALFDDPSDELRALRAVSDRRVAEPLRSIVPERRQVRLDVPDLSALQVLLGDFKEGPVDVLLPAGDYAMDTDASFFLDVRTSGLRLLSADPAQPVTLEGGLRVYGARNVVLDGVSLRHAHGQALTVLGGGHVVVLGGELSARTKVIHAHESDVELIDTRVRALPNNGAFAILAQTIGSARIHARASRFSGGTLYLGQGGGELILDRCVVDAGDRPAVTGQQSARAIVRESLLVSNGFGLSGVARGYVVASVIDSAELPIGRAPTELRLSPYLIDLGPAAGSVPSHLRLAKEPLGPR